MFTEFRHIFALIAIAIITLTSGSVADDIWWTGADPCDNYWNNPNNWSLNRVPASSDNVIITGTQPQQSALIQNSTAAQGNWIMIQPSNPGTAFLTMTGGTIVSSTGANFRLGAFENYNGVFDISGGNVTVATSMAVGCDLGGDGVVNMNGGIINVGWYLSVPLTGGTGKIYLNNGTINTKNFSMDNNGFVDIAQGTLTIEGNVVSTINNYINNGWIRAYKGKGTVNAVFDGIKTRVTAQPPLDILINFEDPEPNSYYSRNGTYTSITTNPAEIISGSKSLKIDTMFAGSGWYELFNTVTSGVSLKGGKRYAISFYYKVLGIDTAGGSYFFFRASSPGTGGVQGDFPFRESFAPYYHEKNIILPAGVNDYRIVLGVNNKGSVVIDDIRIKELEDINVSDEGIVVADSHYEPYGMCTHFDRGQEWTGTGYTNVEVTQAIQMLDDAGVQWIRCGAAWVFTEWDPGSIDYTYLARVDLAVNTALLHGIETFLQIGYPPLWASEMPGATDFWAYGPADQYMSDWADFVTLIANRYKGKVMYWEIGNEVDWTFWKSSLEKYVTFLAIAYDRLKQVDSNNKVVMGGLAFNGVHVWQLIDGADEHALQKLYNAGAKNYFDILAIHPYTYDVEDGTVESIDAINNAYAIMKRNDDGNKPIWITELGISMNGDSPSQNADQAEYLENLYTELIKHPKVEKIFWYNFRAMEGQGDQQDNFGIVNRNLTIKPAYTTLMNLPKSSIRKVNYAYIPEELQTDLNGDGTIDASDLGSFVSNWLAEECTFPNWCNGTDLSHDSNVNFNDLVVLANYWMKLYHP